MELNLTALANMATLKTIPVQANCLGRGRYPVEAGFRFQFSLLEAGDLGSVDVARLSRIMSEKYELSKGR